MSVAIHLAFSARMAGPVIQTDEGAYLGVASQLARGTGQLYRQSPFHPGYGALLAPLARLTSDPTVIYRGALVLNAVCLGAVVPLAFMAARWFVGHGLGRRVAVAALVGAYPPFLAYSNTALEVSVFVPACLGVMVAIGAAVERPAWWRWLVAGVLAGACYGLHVLGVVVVVGTIAVAIVAAGRRQVRVRAVVALLAGLQASVAGAVVLLSRSVAYDQRLAKPLGATVVTRYQAVTGLYNQNAQIHGHLTLLATEAAGQVWYLAVASCGLVIVGAGVALAAAWRVVRHRSRTPADVIAVFGGVLALLGLYASADRFIVTAAAARSADTFVYGRYTEHLVAPLLLVGAAQLIGMRWRPALGWAAAAAAVMAGTGAVVVTQRGSAALHDPVVYVNVIGIQAAVHALGFIDVVPITAGAAALALVVLVVAAWRWSVVAVLLAIAGLSSAAYSANSMTADSHQRAGQRVVLHALTLVDRTVGAPRCVGYDIADGNDWTLANDQTYRPATRFEPFVSQSRAAPCGSLVATSRADLAADYPGARRLALENDEPLGLWVLAGSTQDELARAGLLLPAGFPAPLPGTAFRSRIAAAGPLPVLQGGVPFEVRLAVTHAGRGSPWPSRYGFTSGDGWVSVTAALVPAGAEVALPAAWTGAPRLQLPREVWPGETVVGVLRATVAAGSVTPGRYELVIGMVQEGFTFFSVHGDAPVRIPVQVR